MEIKLKAKHEKDNEYPKYLIRENGILNVYNGVLGNLGIYVRSNKLIYSKNILNIEGSNPINLNINYFSNNIEETYSVATKGFKFNYEQRLVNNIETNEIKYYDGCNKEHTFKKIEGTSKYYDADSLSGLILIKNESPLNEQPYVIEDIQENKLIFNNNGYLIKIEKKTYASTLNTNITYEENKITKIESDNNEDITFKYSKNNLSDVVIINYGSAVGTIFSNTGSLQISLNGNRIIIYTNSVGLIDEITTRGTITSETIFAIIENNCYTKIQKMLVSSTPQVRPNKLIYEYKLSKTEEIYEISYQVGDLITKKQYLFNENGSIKISYEPTDNELFGVTDIKEYLERKNKIQYLNPYNYFHKYFFTNKTIYDQGKVELPLSEIDFPETEIFSIIYDLFYTVTNTNCQVLVQIALGNKILSEEILNLDVKEDAKYEGILNFKIPVNDNFARVDITDLKLNITMINNQNGFITPLEIYIYAHDNISEGILIDVKNASNIKYLIKEINKTTYGYIFNGRMRIDNETIYLTEDEIKLNQRACLKAIKENKTTFLFYYNNFAECKEMETDFACSFYDENGNESEIVTFNNIRIFSYQKIGNKINLEERRLTNYQRIDIIKNQIKEGQKLVETAYYYLTKDEYITSMSDGKIQILNSYDNYGNLLNSSTLTKNYDFIRNVYTYNEKNNQIKESSFSLAGNREISYEYNSRNEVNVIIDAMNHEKKYTINNGGLVTEIEEKNEENILKNTITYAKDDCIDTITSVNGNVYDINYDSYGNISEVNVNTKNIIKQEITYPETNNCKILTITYPNNQQMILTYDKYNHLVEMSSKENNQEKRIITNIFCDYIKGKAIENVADPFDEALVVSRTSKLRKVIEYTDSFVYSYKYHYDHMSRLVRIEKIGLYNIYYKYNAACEIESIERTFDSNDKNKMVITTSYLPETGLTSQMLDTFTMQYINDSETTTYKEQYTYDNFNRIKEINTNKVKYEFEYQSKYNTAPSRGTTNNYLIKKYTSLINQEIYQTDEIEYDLNNNIIKINNVIYSYDEINRLTSEETEESIIQYNFDEKGRLSSITNQNKNTNETKTKTFTYNTINNYDQIIKVNDDEITYDENDNISEYQGKKYFYKQGHQLVKILDEENDIGYEYKYNENGIRKEKIKYQISTNEKLETIEYILQGDKIFKENIYSYENTSKNKTIIYLYGNNGVEGFILKNETYYYVKNYLGDVIAIVDKDNNIKATYTYDSYGNFVEEVKDNNFKDLNSFTYRSYYFDRESKFYYLINRYYFSSLAIFISLNNFAYLDPFSIAGFNLYSYCSFNPVENITIMMAKGHQGNMKSSKYVYWTIEELILRLKELSSKGHLTKEEKEEKRDIERELKARGQHNKAKRKGYYHSQFSVIDEKNNSSSDGTDLNNQIKIIALKSIVGIAIGYILVNDASVIGLVDNFALLILIPLFLGLGGDIDEL